MAASAADFDPYHKWLGIPPRDQPPNHYRLLSLELFEADAEVIEAAASRLISFCESHSHGPHAADARKLLFEIAAARLCLLDVGKRARYDAMITGKPPVTDGTTAGVVRNPNARPTAPKVDRRAPSPRPVVAPPAPPLPSQTPPISHSDSTVIEQPIPASPARKPTRAVQPPPPPVMNVPTPAATTELGGIDDLFDTLATKSSGSQSTRRGKAVAPARKSGAMRTVADKTDINGKKKNNNLLIVGGMAAVALLLIVVAAIVLFRGGGSASTAQEKTKSLNVREKSSSSAHDHEDAPQKAEQATQGSRDNDTPPKDEKALASAANLTIKDESAASGKPSKQRLLELCTRGGSEAELQKLLTDDVDKEASDTNDRTPLRLAVVGGYTPLVKLLIAAKAEVNSQDSQGETPLMSAVQRGDKKLVALLLDAGADPNLASPKRAGKGGGLSPLHVAARQGHADVVDLLIEHAARLDAKNQEGVTPLMVAAWQGHTGVALELMAKGAEAKNIRDNAGQTPLMHAVYGGKLDVVEAMLVRGAMVGQKSKSGANALAIALGAPEPNAKIIEKLRQTLDDEAPALDF